jgi:dTDP-4-dehydrorhamnose reductase
MKVLLIGANGQLGTDLNAVLQRRGVKVRSVIEPELDIRNPTACGAMVGSTEPDIVINTAAFHRVEQCELQPTTAFEVNAVGARNLAAACSQHGATLVHFSTDFVFDGAKGAPYVETDTPVPQSAYAVSKLASEHMVAYTTRRYFLVRTCGLYGVAGPHGKDGNFVDIMLKKAAAGDRIRVVDDQILTPTYTADLAENLARLIATQAYGLYHMTNEGQCSWYEFAAAVFEAAAVKADLAPCKTIDYPTSVRRPSYSVLSKDKFHALDIGRMPHWRDSLSRYLQARQEKRPPAGMHR